MFCSCFGLENTFFFFLLFCAVPQVWERDAKFWYWLSQALSLCRGNLLRLLFFLRQVGQSIQLHGFFLLQKFSVYHLSILYFHIDESGPIFLMCLGLILLNCPSLRIFLVWRLGKKSEILFLLVLSRNTSKLLSLLLFLLML